MPFDGSGNYVVLSSPTFPAVAGNVVKSSYFNAIVNDLANAMSMVLCRDGQSTVTADISLNGHKLKSVTDPTSPQDAATKAYADLKVALTDLAAVEAGKGSTLLGTQRTGTGTYPTTQDQYNQRRAHLFDYIDNATVPHAAILNNTSTVDLAPYLQAAINDIPASGGVLVLPPCDIRVNSPISIGNGVAGTSVSTKNGQVILCDSVGGTDDGTFGGGQRPASTRILYTGAVAAASYLLTLYGPIRNVSLKGIVLDCNGLCGYPINLQHLIECDIDITGTRWRTGQGIAYVPDVALPAGCTLGFFKNLLKIRTKLPWIKTLPSDVGSLLRGTQGFNYLGAPTNNQGFSKNIIECEHVFDNAGTYAMKHRFIDNNQFQEIWTRTSDGQTPTVNPLNAGVGLQISVPQGAVAIGENLIQGAVGGGVSYVFEGTATVANKHPDIFLPYSILDYEPLPTSQLAKVLTTEGVFVNGWTGSIQQWIGRSTGNLATAGTEFYCPLGMSAGGADRFVSNINPGRSGTLFTLEVNLGVAPGGAASRTFTVQVNGVDTALTISFGAAESGQKRIALATPVGVLTNADVVLKSTVGGVPAASSASWSLAWSTTEKILA